MASIVAASHEDINVKYLTENLKTILQGQPKPTKAERQSDAITTSFYEQTQGKILCEIVGLFNYLITKVEKVQEIVGPMRTEITTLTDENAKLKKALVNTRLDFERSQQYHNRDTFKLCGIKEPRLTPGQYEDTADTIIKALNTASIPLKKEDISASYRVPGKEGSRSGPKNLLIKCGLHNTKDRIMRNKKILRLNDAFQKEYPEAFIVEQLTSLRSKVAYMLRHDASVEKTWTINGRIKVVLRGAETNAKPRTIDSLAQLKQVMSWPEDNIEKLVLEQ